MQVSPLQPADKAHVSPLFAGLSVTRLNKEERSRLNATVDSYEADLQTLVKKDRAAHPEQPILQLQIERQVKKMRRFLKRQMKAWKKDPAKAVPFAAVFAGGTASGKTMLMEHMGTSLSRQAAEQKGWDRRSHGEAVDTIVMDNYYADRSKMRREVGDIRFFTEAPLDTPEGLTWKPLQKDLARLKRGEAARIPNHNFVDASTRSGQKLKVPAPFLLMDGILSLTQRKTRNMFDASIFVDADPEARSERWWKRANDRIKNADEIKNILFEKARRYHDIHIEPTKDVADIVIDNRGDSPERLEAVKETVDELAGIWVKATYPVSHD